MNEDFIKEALYSPTANPTFLILVLGVAFILGAIHALGPGHGKSLMAAYLVGARGRVKDAIVLALSITFSHVFSVIVIGFVVFLLMDVFWSEKISLWLGILSGILICAIGLWLLFQRLHLFLAKSRRMSLAVQHLESVNSNPIHHHHHHLSPANHSHRPLKSDPNLSWWSNIVLGISSGIVPCPKALVILLLAISMQKVLFGITIITVFSLGMALVLIAIGIILVKASHLLRDRFHSQRIQLLPVLGSILIIILGFVITFRTIQLL